MAEKAGAKTFIPGQCVSDFDGEAQTQLAEGTQGMKPSVVGVVLNYAAGDGS